jgi:hypothetical protein
MTSQILKWLKYSGGVIVLKLNPLHWRFSCKMHRSAEIWEQDAFVLELFPITIRFWFDNGDW